jgi:uncharacterized cupin superfamily protein
MFKKQGNDKKCNFTKRKYIEVMSKILIKKLDDVEIQQRGINNWPIWEKEISRFDWQYDNDEECLIMEGEVAVESEEGTITFGKGDFVTFKKGLKCVWDVKKPVKKHYNFP